MHSRLPRLPAQRTPPSLSSRRRTLRLPQVRLLPRRSPRLRHRQRPPQNRYRCRRHGPTSSRSVSCVAAAYIALITAAAETAVLELACGIAARAAPQAQLERRRAGVVGERCQTDQTAAEKAARRQGRDCLIGWGNAEDCKTRRIAEATSSGQNFARAEATVARSAAPGAAGTP